MIKFIVNEVGHFNAYDIEKQIEANDSIIITSSKKMVLYKKFFNTYNNVRIINLKQLIYQIYQDNINTLPVLTSEEQTLFFIRALKLVKSDLNYLGDHSFDMIADLINIYKNETNHMLIKNNYQTPIIEDITLIINAYLKLIKDNYIDEQILYKEVLNFLKGNKIYVTKNIVISDIYYFNEVEKLIVKELINNCNNGYLYFLNDKHIPGAEIHSDTFNYFKESFSNNYILEKLDNKIDPNREFIINNLYSLDNEVSPKSDYVKLYGASDLYDEVVFVANQISNLIRTKGYRYHDFAIVSNAINDYENYFDLIFKDNNIPYHKNTNINANFFNYILRLLDVMSGDVNKETLINILKSGFYNFDDEYINQIIKDGEDLFLESSIIKPLINMDKNKNISELLLYLYNYLEQFKILNIINLHDSETWDEFIKILDVIYLVYKDSNMTTLELKECLNYFFKSVKVQTNYLDEVLVGDTSVINSLTPKVVFFIGVNEGVVPSKATNNILLNNFETLKYYQNYPKFNNILIDKFNTFYAMVCPSDEIFITYYKISKSGSKTNPAAIIKKIKSMYQELTVFDKEDLNNLVSLPNLTYNHYLTSDNEKLKDYLKKYFDNHSYYQKYNKLIDYIPRFYDIEKINFTNLDYLSLSPSSMDVYNYCSFQYFCKYILKLEKKESFKYDNRIVGTYIHYLFQNLISNCATKDNISGMLSFWKKEFIKKEEINVTRTMDYMFDKLNNSVLKLWPFMYDEINNNKFVSGELELNISSSLKYEPIVLQGNNIPIYLRGIIDRVDLYNNYVRVIDYKTGSKAINLNDMVYSLNLQLFIYLLFIKKSKPDLIPSGLFYMPSLIKYERTLFDYKNYRLSGMFIDNKEVIEALGGDDINNYIDAYTRDKFKDGVKIEESSMDDILKFTEKRIIDTANNILDGNFKINPLKGKDLCQYCPYQAICGIEEGSNLYRKYQKHSKDEVWDIVRGEINELD